jgi:hypothetical protein
MMFLVRESATGLPSFIDRQLAGARELGRPSNTVTLFFFIRCSTPPLSWLATLRERSTIFLGGRSVTSFTDRP